MNQLLYAFRYGHVDIVRLLLEKEADKEAHTNTVSEREGFKESVGVRGSIVYVVYVDIILSPLMSELRYSDTCS